MLDIFGEDKALFDDLIRQEKPDIERVAKEVAALLNTLSPEGAIYAHTWVGAELIHSLIDDGDAAVELSRHLQHRTEIEMRQAPKYAAAQQKPN